MKYLFFILVFSVGCTRPKFKCVDGKLYENAVVFPLFSDNVYVQWEYIKDRPCVVPK